ncbi:MAG: peptidoglycan-binding protein [Clostridia bacterium]|nr:peptidoglycan-binding protein [Clostridia bacterium]
MKKTWKILIAAVLLLALGAAAMASLGTLYIKENKVKIYKKADKSSKVIATLNGNDKVTWEDEVGSWCQISFKVDGKKKTGWVQGKYVSDDPVPSHCKHKWGSWKVTKEATCKRGGYKARYCSKCGLMEEADIPRTDHTYGKWKTVEEATCTETGKQERTCKVCGHTQSRKIEKTGHDYGKWIVTEEATCTETGTAYRRCKVCGHKTYKDIPTVEHDYGKWTVTEEPTCTETGSRYRKCRVCGHRDVDTLAKVDHDYGKWTVTEEPTCTTLGSRYRKCRVCGRKDTQEMAKLPHDYEYKVLVEATDHSSGTRAQVCKVCGHATGEVSYDPEGTLRRGDRGEAVYNLQQLLVDQGYLNAGGADGIYGGGTEKAVIRFQTDQTLNADGVAWPQTLRRLEHEFGPWETVKALTRSEAGERMRICTDCGYVQRETVNAGLTYERGARGEAIRAMQQMMNVLGYNAGSVDGIYGGKLDSAFAAFAADNGLSFNPGRVCPADVDALVNAWLETDAGAGWKGEGDAATPVDLALTVTPDSEADAGAEIRTYNWTLTNMGPQKATFAALLLSYGDQTDFRQENLTMALDGIELLADCGNSASGSFTVAADWGEGTLNFAALAVDDRTGDKWLSNTVTFESDLTEVGE